MVTDYSGAVIQDELHYPWGQEWTMAGTMTEERFASLHHRDSATNLDPTHFRMYSSDEGRWLTPDPAQADLFRPQSMSRYSYAVNNPTALVDPQGLFGYCYYGQSDNYCNLPPDIIQTCSQQAVFAGACYGGSSPAPPNSNLGGDGGGYNGPVIAPAPPKPPRPPRPPPPPSRGFSPRTCFYLNAAAGYAGIAALYPSPASPFFGGASVGLFIVGALGGCL